MCFGLSVLVAVSSVMWVARGTAQKNTVTLLRKTADVAVARLIDQITIHLGAARSQSEFLAEMIGRGEIGAKDRENLADALLGALAAAPQVTGIGYFRSEEHTSELQSLMRISYAVFCLKKKTHTKQESW